MGRKKEDSEGYVVEQVQKVIGKITNRATLGKAKTWDDLWDVAYQWCGKNYAHSEQVAEEWGVAPAYLVLAALLYVEHPLLVADGRSWKYTLTYSLALLVQVEIARVDVGVPIKPTNKIHKPVETIPYPVERMV